jgi:hypothetical protein
MSPFIVTNALFHPTVNGKKHLNSGVSFLLFSTVQPIFMLKTIKSFNLGRNLLEIP